jgi:predicted nucleotidyltransferase
MNRYQKLKQALEQILQTLISQYNPEKVILFGSLASSDVGEWSDLDLVIIKETQQPFIQRSVEIALYSCRNGR